jgi:hypothetical protein
MDVAFTAPPPPPCFLPQGEEWHFDYSIRDVCCSVVHGKNDRRHGSSPLTLVFPRGPLVKLMLAHVFAGQRMLTLERGDAMIRLFVTRQGKEFSDATFVHFWRTLMEATDTNGIEYFPPSKARTVFVEDYTSRYGVEPDMWDGAASVMGNCVRQWEASYNPSRRQRLAQKAVEAHAQYSARRMEDAS